MNSKPRVLRNGSIIWKTSDGQWHRDGDKPASISWDGTIQFWKNDKRHRDGDLPAVIHPDGLQFWYKNGQEYTPKGQQ